MNKIIENIIKKKQGHYIHAIEVQDLQDLKACIETLTEELYLDENNTLYDIIDFFYTLEIYYIGIPDDTEEEVVYDFDVLAYMKQVIHNLK